MDNNNNSDNSNQRNSTLSRSLSASESLNSALYTSYSRSLEIVRLVGWTAQDSADMWIPYYMCSPTNIKSSNNISVRSYSHLYSPSTLNQWQRVLWTCQTSVAKQPSHTYVHHILRSSHIMFIRYVHHICSAHSGWDENSTVDTLTHAVYAKLNRSSFTFSLQVFSVQLEANQNNLTRLWDWHMPLIGTCLWLAHDFDWHMTLIGSLNTTTS